MPNNQPKYDEGFKPRSVRLIHAKKLVMRGAFQLLKISRDGGLGILDMKGQHVFGQAIQTSCLDIE